MIWPHLGSIIFESIYAGLVLQEEDMKLLWAPWRIGFILKADSKGGCFLCQYPREDKDEANLILFRGEKNYIILNAYPYNSGHLMVTPYRHIGKLQDMTDIESNEHFELIKTSVKLLTEVLKPSGFNTGMNLGRIAGAGIADHIHTHIVPRWEGDANFMPVLSETKVIPESLPMTYCRLKDGMAGIL
jgi:ATP adenylyltransferase